MRLPPNFVGLRKFLKLKMYLRKVEGSDKKHPGDEDGLERSLQGKQRPSSADWQAEWNAGQENEVFTVPDKSIHQMKKKDKRFYSHESQPVKADLSSEHAWQPLESKPPAKEDLASIFQLEFDDRQNSVKSPPHSQGQSGPLAQKETSEEQLLFDIKENQKDILTALAATVFNTTFYLVPRFKEHYLLGDLAQSLRLWMPEISEIYGWELDHLSIRPDYLKWTLLDFPECLTLKTLSVIRNWTSKRIFENFPALQVDQNITDFWSPGYLVDTQDQDYPTQVLIAHVSRNRPEESRE